MDDYSIKVLSWIGISMVITYRMFFLNSNEGISQTEGHIIYPRRKPYYDISEFIRKNIKLLTELIKEDTDYLIAWIKRVEQTSAIWKTGETKTLPESIKFQMVSVNGCSPDVAHRIMVLPKHTADKEAFNKQIKGTEENMTDCDEEENNTLTEWLSQYKETIIQSIRKDAMTFIEMLKGDSKLTDESIRKDIDSLTRTPRLSCKGMCRYYTIILAKTTSNKGTSTEYILHDKETLTEYILHDKETSTEYILQDKETSTEYILQDKETPTECILQDKETSTEYILQDKETSTEYILHDKETSTEWILQDKDTDWIQHENTPLKYCILHNTISEQIPQNNEPPTECILEDEETMTVGSLQESEIMNKGSLPDEETMTEGSLPNEETMTEGSLPDEETMTGGSLQDKDTMTAHTTNIRQLFEPGCPSALDITPTTIKLTWDEPIVGADGYEIKCEQKQTSFVCYYKTYENACEFIVKGLKGNTEYEFSIQAVKNEVNKGPQSKALKVSTSVVANYSIANLLYMCFYIIVLIWFTYLLCYIVFIR